MRAPRLAFGLALLLSLSTGALARKPAAPPAPAADAAASPSSPGEIAAAIARERATALLQEGNRLLDKALYLEALKAFEEAYRLFPSPKLHFNLAQTNNELGRPLAALEHYEAYLHDVRREDNPELWRLAHERIFLLRGAIASVDVVANVTDAQVTVDGVAAGSTPLEQPLRLMPGPHAIVLAKAGHERQVIELELKAGEAVTRRVELLTDEQGAATRKVVQRLEAERRAAHERLERGQREEQARRERGRYLLRSIGAGLLVAGAVVMLAGGALGGLGLNEAQQVESAKAGTAWSSLDGNYRRAGDYYAGMYAGLAVGGAAFVTGAVLLGLGRRGAPEAPRLVPSAGPGQAGLGLAGSF